ncbi:MAG: response regulator transcription factor [Bdellovibrionaceae bacterium]|nr:response regulator transcription factor [Pseudobdellovibrionaceae bacterium]
MNNAPQENQLVTGFRDYGYRVLEKEHEAHLQNFIPNVLAVEDSLEYQIIIRGTLERELHLFFASTIQQAKELLNCHEIHLILLDVLLPDGSGFEFCNDLQASAATSKIPIVFLTSKTGITDKVLGLNLGADDYITKPFAPLELKARIESKLKKSLLQEQSDLQLHRGHLRFDTLTYVVYSIDNENSKLINMTPIEYRILLHLAQKPGRIFSRNQLIESVWGRAVHINERSIDKHIYTVRKKLGPHGQYIKTIPSLGYQFNIDNLKIEEMEPSHLAPLFETNA